MSRRNKQLDSTVKSKDLDLHIVGTTSRRNRKKNKVLKPHEKTLMNHMIGKVISLEANKRRLMYIDVATGIASPVTIGNNTTSTFAALVSCTTSITQGAGQAARTSDQIWLSKLHINASIIYNFSASVLSQDYVNLVRMTVFIWKPNTAQLAPTPGQLFQNVSTTSVYSLFDFELADQYTILSDEYITVSGFYDSTTSFALPTNASLKHITQTIGLRNIQVAFTPSATTASNHLYVAFTSNSSAGPAPLLQITCRTYFYNDNS